MTQQEFNEINWHRGNVAKLKNGKEYLVKGIKGHGRWLLLYSEEYDKCFVADYRIVDCRTSDYEEPEEVYLEKKRKHQEEAAAKREAERQEYLRAKAERKQKNIEAQVPPAPEASVEERAHQEALARKAANRQKNGQVKVEPKTEAKPTTPVETKKVEAPKVTEPTPKAVEPALEAPEKRVRQRIRITAATPVREKVEFFKKK